MFGFNKKPNKNNSWFTQPGQNKCKYCGNPVSNDMKICPDCKDMLNSGSGTHGGNREEDIDPMEDGED